MKKLVTFLFTILIFPAFGQLIFDDFLNEKKLAEVLIGDNIEIERVEYFGSVESIRKFENKGSQLSMQGGLILSTGHFEGALGPNNRQSSTTIPTSLGYKYELPFELNEFTGAPLFDIVMLDIWFVPQCDSIAFQYVFASEEYPEYVGRVFNDAFGFFLSGPDIKKSKNLALIPNSQTPITINSLNQNLNTDYYIDSKNRNNRNDELQFDGMSVKLSAAAKVIPGKNYKIRIVIADVGDSKFDSAVFLEANSFSCFNSAESLAAKNNKPNELIIESFILEIPFAFNSDEIPKNYFEKLDKIAVKLQKNNQLKLRIEGHTDDKGSDDFNLTLSEKRTASVKKYLIKKGISETRLETKGWGEENPVIDEPTEFARSKNRRVEFLFIEID